MKFDFMDQIKFTKVCVITIFIRFLFRNLLKMELEEWEKFAPEKRVY